MKQLKTPWIYLEIDESRVHASPLNTLFWLSLDYTIAKMRIRDSSEDICFRCYMFTSLVCKEHASKKNKITTPHTIHQTALKNHENSEMSVFRQTESKFNSQNEPPMDRRGHPGLPGSPGHLKDLTEQPQAPLRDHPETSQEPPGTPQARFWEALPGSPRHPQGPPWKPQAPPGTSRNHLRTRQRHPKISWGPSATPQGPPTAPENPTQNPT